MKFVTILSMTFGLCVAFGAVSAGLLCCPERPLTEMAGHGFACKTCQMDSRCCAPSAVFCCKDFAHVPPEFGHGPACTPCKKDGTCC